MADLELGVVLRPSTIAAMERLSTPPHPAMTADHRAAPELWAAAEKWGANTMDMANCILELRDRVAALEATQQKIRSGPESPLVERVADAIAAQATSAGIVNDRPARAALAQPEPVADGEVGA